MPEIGEITTGRKLGRGSGHKYIWLACVNCCREWWATEDYAREKDYHILCRACYNKKLGERQKGRVKKPGSKRVGPNGYILVRLSPDDFFYPMAHKGYVAEHRLVMAQHLNRCLLPWEVVHHKDGVKAHNWFENLHLFSIQAEHVPFTEMKNQLRFLQRRVTQLEAEVALLRVQLEEAKCYE